MKRILSIALLAIPFASTTADEIPPCPARLAVAQAIDGPPPDGWHAYGSRDRLPLKEVSFYYGPPDKLALLVPNRMNNSAKVPRAEWDFPTLQEDYWVACEYSSTTVIVARPLPKDVAACTVWYDPNASAPTVKSWRCRSGRR